MRVVNIMLTVKWMMVEPRMIKWHTVARVMQLRMLRRSKPKSFSTVPSSHLLMGSLRLPRVSAYICSLRISCQRLHVLPRLSEFENCAQ